MTDYTNSNIEENPLISLKCSNEDFNVEYDVLPLVELNTSLNDSNRRIVMGIASINEQLSVLDSKLQQLNSDIERLTNHADGIDYAIAVTSGIITGIIDATVVGEWNFQQAKKESSEEINNKVIEFAKKHPDYSTYCNYALELKGNPRLKPKDPNRLGTAIGYLEWKYPLPGDGAYRKGNFGIGARTHRLDDLCHHPTLVGLVCCIIVQFTESTLYVNSFGENVSIPITVNEYGNFVGNNPITKMISGIINWFITCAKTMANRKGHLMSDVATPSSLPGSFLSIIHELASIPLLKNESFLTQLRHSYTKGIGSEKGQIDLGAFNALFEGAHSKLDITTEKAIFHEIKRQTIPVIINEALVRGVYFIRRFISELKEKKSVRELDWKKIVPFNNRTIVRMMTIATGTFTTIDLADAAIHAAGKSVDTMTFFSNMLLRVNFVGIGRFTIAVSTDVYMGTSKAIKRNAIIKIQEQQLFLLNAKLSYKQADMWIAAEASGQSLIEVHDMIAKNAKVYAENLISIKESLASIGSEASDIEKKNSGLLSEISNTLKWG